MDWLTGLGITPLRHRRPAFRQPLIETTLFRPRPGEASTSDRSDSSAAEQPFDHGCASACRSVRCQVARCVPKSQRKKPTSKAAFMLVNMVASRNVRNTFG
jgi:hypothetical protein